MPCGPQLLLELQRRQFRDDSPGLGAPLASYREISHGESFLQLPEAVLDETEAALSFWGQLALMADIADGVKGPEPNSSSPPTDQC